jgi:hypothetical protein
MKISKKRQARWNNMRPLVETEIGQSANPVFVQALRFCLDTMEMKHPVINIQDVRGYIIEIEDRVNYLIYHTTDILRTNALMECADIIREAAEDTQKDYRLEGDETS